MAKRCPITGKHPGSGNTVSKAKNRHKRRFNPNLVSKRVWNPQEKRWVRMRISTKALKTLTKTGMVR